LVCDCEKVNCNQKSAARCVSKSLLSAAQSWPSIAACVSTKELLLWLQYKKVCFLQHQAVREHPASHITKLASSICVSALKASLLAAKAMPVSLWLTSVARKQQIVCQHQEGSLLAAISGLSQKPSQPFAAISCAYALH